MEKFVVEDGFSLIEAEPTVYFLKVFSAFSAALR